jgi:hypothetical protein
VTGRDRAYAQLRAALAGGDDAALPGLVARLEPDLDDALNEVREAVVVLWAAGGLDGQDSP